MKTENTTPKVAHQAGRKNRWNVGNQPDHGRFITVFDGVIRYWTPIEAGEDWKKVFWSFSDGYDHGGLSGECSAECWLCEGDDQIASAKMTFDQCENVTSFTMKGGN